MNLGILCFYFCTCCFLQIHAMDMDYYFGFDDSSLRSDRSCLTYHGQKHCEKMCGTSLTLCSSEGQCYCLQTKLKTLQSEIVVAFKAKRDQRRGKDFQPKHFDEDYYEFDLDHMLRSEDQNQQSEESKNEDLLLESDEFKKPALRHHIAHFCPNLSIARECIKTCMKVGKPAFCGKDHICYCGHRYSSYDVDVEKDPKKVYGEFQDIYAKYFGPNIASDENGTKKRDGNA